MSSPLVSILMPSYNHAPFIKQAIESALHQTYSNIELLISDDGSTDNSAQIIQSFTDERIKTHFFDKNIGPFNNLKACADMAKGAYIALLYSDDFWELTKLEKQVAFLENNLAYSAAFTYPDVVDVNGRVLMEDEHVLCKMFYTGESLSYKEFMLKLTSKNFLCAPSALIRMELWRLYFDKSFIYKQMPDYYLWMNIIKHGPMFIVPERLTSHRVIGTNISAKTVEGIGREKNEQRLIFRNFMRDIPDDLFLNLFCGYEINAETTCDHEECLGLKLVFLLQNLKEKNLVSIGIEILSEIEYSQKVFDVLQRYGISMNKLYEINSTYELVRHARGIFEKYEMVIELLRNPTKKVGFYVDDAEFSTQLIGYLLEHEPSAYQNLLCLVSDFEDNHGMYAGKAVVSMQAAKDVYNINCLVVTSYQFQEEILQLAEDAANADGKIEVVTLFKSYEVEAALYEVE